MTAPELLLITLEPADAEMLAELASRNGTDPDALAAALLSEMCGLLRRLKRDRLRAEGGIDA